MKSKRKSSRSTKKLILNQDNRKLKLSKSSHQLSPPLKSGSYCKSTSQSDNFQLSFQHEHSISIYISKSELKEQFKKYSYHLQVQWLEKGFIPFQKKMVIISKIEEFNEQYNQLFTEEQPQHKQVEWIILSKAINSDQIQEDFNQRYIPVKFRFLPSMAQIINYLNFPLKANGNFVSFDYFSSIINFQAFPNEYSSIQQLDPNEISMLTKPYKQLWLISKKHKSLLKDIQIICYFIEDFCVKNNQVQIPFEKNILYIIEENYKLLLNNSVMQPLQNRITLGQIKKLMLSNMHPHYCEKVFQKLEVDLIFCLIDFPAKIVKQFCKHISEVAVFKNRKISQSNIFLGIYYEKKQQSNYFGIQFNRQQKIENQIFRIKSHCQAVKKLKRIYNDLPSKVNKITIVSYNIKEKQLLHEIQLLTKIKVLIVQQFDSLLNYPKETIIVGEFNKDNKKHLFSFTDLHIIDYKQCEHNSFIVHNQLAIYLKGFLKHEQGYAFLAVSSRIISYNVELQEVKNNPLYVNQLIQYFGQSLKQLEQCCNHLLILKMSDYNESLQILVKNIEKQKSISFEIYLEYGHQFIIRSNSSKYTFITREKLIKRIKEVSLQNRACSTFRYYNNEKQPCIDYQTENTITRYYQGDISKSKELLIIIPKTFPFCNLLYRFANYNFLIYHNQQQLRYFVRHVGNKYHAVILLKRQKYNNIEAKKSNIQIQQIDCLTQKQVREKIDQIVQKQQFNDKWSMVKIKNKKMFQSVVIYNQNDQKQNNLCAQMNQIFRQANVISLSKTQFNQLENNYKLKENIIIYQIGKLQLSSTIRIKNITDLLKIYMSPFGNSLYFSPQIFLFSLRQKYIWQYTQSDKTRKLKGKLHGLSLQQTLSKTVQRSKAISPSPQNKILKTKQYFVQHGISIIQSQSLRENSKRQKFGNKKQLIQLVYNNISKGNTVIILLNQSDYFTLMKQHNINTPGVIWVVAVKNLKFLLVKSQDIIYCLIEQIENILKQIADQFKTFFSNRQSSIQSNEYFSDISPNFEIFDHWENYLKYMSSTNLQHKLKIITDQSLKKASIQDIKEALLFPCKQKAYSFLQSSQSILAIKQNPSIKNQQIESIIILVHIRNKFFIENCLKILSEQNCVIVSFNSIFEIIKYSQITKTLLVLQKNDDVRISRSIYLNAADTPASFNRKLRIYLDSLRNLN